MQKKKQLSKGYLKKKITTLIKPALESLDEIKEKFELIFIDADKGNYKEYYESDEANLDSKSDAKVILFLIIVAVIAMTYWVAVQ